MRFIKFALAFFLILNAANAQESNDHDVVDKSVFRIISVGQGFLGKGTGFLVSRKGHIVTNHHVIAKANRIFVLRRGSGSNKVVEAKLVRSDKDVDLAVIQASIPDVEPLSIRIIDPEKGDSVSALGFPGLADNIQYKNLKEFVKILNQNMNYSNSTLTIGNVSRIVRNRTAQGGSNINLIQHTATISEGNSGGPLLDKCGDVIGVNTFGYFKEARTGVLFSVAGSELGEYLVRYAIPVDIKESRCGAPNNTILIGVSLTGLLLAILGGFFVFRQRRAQVNGRSGVRVSDSSPPTPSQARTTPIPGFQDKSRQWSIKLNTASGRIGARLDSSKLAQGFTIGRDPKHAFTIDQSDVSWNHASMSLKGGDVYIRDLGSTNGTFVNGRQLTEGVEVVLSPGDKIQIGTAEGEFDLMS